MRCCCFMAASVTRTGVQVRNGVRTDSVQMLPASIHYHCAVARYTIQYEPEAEEDLKFHGRKVEALARAAVDRYLSDQPLPPVGQRKALDANPLGAPYRLRVADYRAFYRVDEAQRIVYVLRVGYKPAETLYLRGQPIPMRD